MPATIKFGNPVALNLNKTMPTFSTTGIKKPVFSDNTKAFYRKGSLAAGGIGTVRNARHKSKYI